MTMEEFLFHKTGIRRGRDEQLHDVLVVAKDGLKRTRVMYESNLGWVSMNELFKSAEAEGLMEEVEAPRRERHWKKKPTIVWKTTEEGLRYAKNIYDNSKLPREIED